MIWLVDNTLQVNYSSTVNIKLNGQGEHHTYKDIVQQYVNYVHVKCGSHYHTIPLPYLNESL